MTAAACLCGIVPIKGADAQDSQIAPLEMTIDGVTIDGTHFKSVTISADTPLRLSMAQPAARDCIRKQTASTPHFGRNGALSDREFAMAQTAWSYFVNSFQPDTGLVNAVGSFPSTTMWDTASYISALVSAYELCVIDKREFDSRATKLINTLRNLDLFRGKKGAWAMKNMPPKVSRFGGLMWRGRCRRRPWPIP